MRTRRAVAALLLVLAASFNKFAAATPPAGSMPAFACYNSIADALWDAAPASEGDLESYDGDGCVRWYFEAEALMLQRSQRSAHGNQPVVLEELTNDVLLRSQDATIANAAGPRLVLGRYLSDSSAVELLYWGISSWTGSASVSGNNNLNIPGDLGLATLDFRDADTMTIRQESELHNAEINYVLERERFTLLGGFRYLRFRDQFDIHSIDTSGPDTGASDYAVTATNNLYGGQLGARFNRQRGIFGWDLTGKAGIFGNDVSQRNLVRDFDNTFVFRNTGGNETNVAFIGEINVSGRVQITRHVALRAGYNLIWIEGLGLAGDHLDFTNTPTSGTAVTSSGGVFLHGVNVGMHASW